MTTKLRFSALVEGQFDGSNDLGTPSIPLRAKAILEFLAGTDTGEADKLFSDRRTLAASATENLDLAGTLTDPFGAVISFVEVVALYIKASAANTNDVVVGGAASAAWVAPFGDATDKVNVKPGGALLLMCDAGYAVTATTADILKIANSGGTTGVTYDIVILGRSA